MGKPNHWFISIIEAAYVVYMLNYFETTYTFETRQCFLADLIPGLTHPIQPSTTPTSKVCPKGNKVSWIFAAYLLLRNLDFRKTLNYAVLAGGVAMSLLNLNVFVYLIPVFITEFFII